MPLPRKQNNKIDWKTLIIGKDWKSFAVWTMLTIAILLMAYGYKYDNQQFIEVYSNPCAYCEQCSGINFNQDIKLDVIQPNGEKEEDTTTNIIPSNS